MTTKHHGKHRVVKPDKSRMTPLLVRFVQEYLIDLNATAAWIRAGGSARSAHNNGPRALRYPHVIEALERAKAARNVRTGITQDKVLAELSALAFSSIRDYVDNGDGTISLAAGVPEIAWKAIASQRVHVDKWGCKHVEVRLWDKPQTLHRAGRHVGLFPDRVELTGKDGAPLYLQKLTDDELAQLKEIAERAAGRD